MRDDRHSRITSAAEAFSRLVLFHRVLDTAPAQAMKGFLDTAMRGESPDSVEQKYLELVRILYDESGTASTRALVDDAWQNHLLCQLLSDENAMTMGAAFDALDDTTLQAATHDLRLLQSLFELSGQVCREMAASEGDPADLPLWPRLRVSSGEEEADPSVVSAKSIASELTGSADWADMAERLENHFRQAGAGLPGTHWYLRWDGSALRGVARPNVFHIEDLIGLQDAKTAVLGNTEQFLDGVPANNLLLYGSRGTGKSSMVRGLISRYGARGLRLVEIARGCIGSLPSLFPVLRRYPQRFVIFLDDLSFDESEVDFKAFKSDMEGALEQRPDNVLLYATSNRRHLVPERWSDRHTPETAEVHGQDAMEEKLSLADRFGLTVYFTTPDQDEYLAIVEHMAARRGLKIDRTRLREAALQWIMWNNPRSGRSARQFVDDLAGKLMGGAAE